MSILELDPRDATFTVEHKGQTRAIHFSQRTLRTVKARLDQLGISPDAFTWRPKQLETASPYPGFESFTQGEAALFFGRAGDIARGLAEVRKLRRLGAGRIMLIQAASGAGKSSFLKAGLWPRLERDPEFLPVSILRPVTGIHTGDQGLGRQLAAFFAKHRQPRPASAIHQALQGDTEAAADALVGLINEATAIGQAMQMVARPGAPAPTPLIAVDQAEELFAASDQEESRRFLDIVARVLDPERITERPSAARLAAAPVLIWTIRADSLDTLLHATDAARLKPPLAFLLPPIPRENYREIIESPLAAAGQAGMRLSIDPLLVDALVSASKGADALPLLAFTLRQLLEDNRTGAQARLTLDRFEAAGGMSDVLRKRLATAQRSTGASPEQLRGLMVPHLATWDEEVSPPVVKRLVSNEASLLADAGVGLKPLVDALVEGRLLTRAGAGGQGTTLEVAHEALLRLPPLDGWLAEDREFLVWRDRTGKARALYEASARGPLVGRELDIAREWLNKRKGSDIAEVDRAFIKASVMEDEQRRKEEEKRERRLRELEAEVSNLRSQVVWIAQPSDTEAHAIFLAEQIIVSAENKNSQSCRAISNRTAHGS